MTPDITEVNFQSDSPSTQYRNRSLFYAICRLLSEQFEQIRRITWNYSEAGHGKGIPDGVGATVKGASDNAVKYGEDVHTFDALVSVLSRKCHKTYIDTVDEAYILKVDEELPLELETFKGTMTVHQFKWTKVHPVAIHFNSVSCFECPPEEECIHYGLPNSPWTISTPSCSELTPDEPHGEQAAGEQVIIRGDWLAVKYGTFSYPGKFSSRLKITMLEHMENSPI